MPKVCRRLVARTDTRSIARALVNLSRLRFDRASGLLVYEPKAGHEFDDDPLTDPLEFLARVLIHIPEPNKHLVHFYGAYSNRLRSSLPNVDPPDQTNQSGPPRRALSKRWRELIFRIYEVDPLTCTQCGGVMKILAFITDHANIQNPPPPRQKLGRIQSSPSDNLALIETRQRPATPPVCLESNNATAQANPSSLHGPHSRTNA